MNLHFGPFVPMDVLFYFDEDGMWLWSVCIVQQKIERLKDFFERELNEWISSLHLG